MSILNRTFYSGHVFGNGAKRYKMTMEQIYRGTLQILNLFAQTISLRKRDPQALNDDYDCCLPLFLFWPVYQKCNNKHVGTY